MEANWAAIQSSMPLEFYRRVMLDNSRASSTYWGPHLVPSVSWKLFMPIAAIVIVTNPRKRQLLPDRSASSSFSWRKPTFGGSLVQLIDVIKATSQTIPEVHVAPCWQLHHVTRLLAVSKDLCHFVLCRCDRIVRLVFSYSSLSHICFCCQLLTDLFTLLTL